MFKDDKNILVKFDNVSFGYQPKKLILQKVSFFVKKNEHVAIIGSNGSGKSTLAKIIVGLFKPRSGNIYFNNKLINKTNIHNLKSSSGIIFENPDNQFIGLSTEDDIAFGLENKCVPHKKMQSIINETAKFVGISHLLKASVKQLSGGQKQLVAIASVLAMNPQLMVFDEATSMLDCQTKKRINKLIQLLKNKKHKTIITITHDMDEAEQADRIIVMHKGRVALVGAPKEIFNNKQLSSLSIDKPFLYKLAQRINYEK